MHIKNLNSRNINSRNLNSRNLNLKIKESFFGKQFKTNIIVLCLIIAVISVNIYFLFLKLLVQLLGDIPLSNSLCYILSIPPTCIFLGLLGKIIILSFNNSFRFWIITCSILLSIVILLNSYHSVLTEKLGNFSVIQSQVLSAFLTFTVLISSIFWPINWIEKYVVKKFR